MKRKLLIGSVFSAFFLFLALRGIQWGVLGEVLLRTQYLYLIPSIFFSLLGLYARAYRWRFVLLPVKTIPTNRLFAVTTIGFMANNLLPARLGELVRAYVLGRQEQISKTASFATIVYERVVDIFSLLAFLWISLFKVTGPDWLRTTGLWLLVLNAALLALLLLMERNRKMVNGIVARLVRPLPQRYQNRIVESSAAFLSGLASVSRRATLLPIAVSSVVVWLATILGVYYCFGAVEMELPFVASVTLIVLISFGNMIPSAPAFVGTTQYACIVGLAMFGIGKSEALAYSIVYHATIFFPFTLAGLIFLWRTQIRFDEISRNY